MVKCVASSVEPEDKLGHSQNRTDYLDDDIQGGQRIEFVVVYYLQKLSIPTYTYIENIYSFKSTKLLPYFFSCYVGNVYTIIKYKWNRNKNFSRNYL